MTSQNLKNRFLFLSILLLFISSLSLVFNFHHSRIEEVDHFYTAEKNIIQIIRLSGEIDKELLAVLNFQLNNFDSLARKTRQLKQIQKQIQSNQLSWVNHLPIEGIKQQVETYLSESWLQLALLEQLKSNFASYKISLRYIPVVISQLKNLVSSDVRVQIIKLYALLLQYHLFTENNYKQQLIAQIHLLEQISLTGKVQIMMKNLLFHSKANLAFQNDIQVIFQHYKQVTNKTKLLSIEKQLDNYVDKTARDSITANSIFLVSIGLLFSGFLFALYYFYLERKKVTLSRDLFYDAIESIEESFAIYDQQDKLLTWNRNFEQLYPKLKGVLKQGLSFEQLIEEGFKRDQFDCSDESRNELRKIMLQSHKKALKNVTEHFSNGRSYLSNSSRTSTGGLASVHIDITERQKMEAHLLALSRAVEQSPNTIVITDTDGFITYVNPKFEQLTGYTEQEVMGKNPRILKSGDQSVQQYRNMWETIHAGKVWHGTFHNKKKNGELFWERAILTAIRDDNNKITAYLAIKEDITKSKSNEDQLRMAATVFRTSSEAIIVSDENKRIKLVNPSFERITGYSAEEVLGKDPALLKSGKQGKKFYRQMWITLRKKGRWQGEIWNRRKNGEIYPEWLSIAMVKNEQQQISEYVAVFSDISERKKSEDKILWQANFDQLTELPNRSLFLDRLKQFIRTYQRDKKIFALLFMDLNRFKIVNDTLGHSVGDQLLKMVARRLAENLAESDSIARFGGDEFTILLPRIKKAEDAAHVAQRIIAILTEPFDINDSDVFIGISIGITMFPNDAIDEISLIRNADMAMYHAKESGKNGFHFFTKEMNDQMLLRMKLEKDLRYAIINNELFLEYQPVVSVLTEEVIGAEALVRWKHPKYGRLGPDKFISIAEETGMIKQLGEWVLKQALLELSYWHKEGYKKLHIAVNVSSLQRILGLSAEKIQLLLNETAVDGKFLTIEMTESLMMEHTEDSLKWLQSLKQSGLNLSIDDFGTGYSSLSYLHRFPMDILKIDKSFVDEMLELNNSAKLVESIISLAHHFDLSVVAEGVENYAQLEFLRQLGCDNIQGYYYSKPLSGKNFLNFIDSTRRT